MIEPEKCVGKYDRDDMVDMFDMKDHSLAICPGCGSHYINYFSNTLSFCLVIYYRTKTSAISVKYLIVALRAFISSRLRLEDIRLRLVALLVP